MLSPSVDRYPDITDILDPATNDAVIGASSDFNGIAPCGFKHQASEGNVRSIRQLY
jgi:hypothetical protein